MFPNDATPTRYVTKSAAIQQLDEVLEITQSPFYRAVNGYRLPFGAHRKHASDDRFCAVTQPAFIDLGPAPGVCSGDICQLGSICVAPNQANDAVKSAQLNHSTRAEAANTPDESLIWLARINNSIPAAGARLADLTKLAAILSPSLAALFGREQTAYVPQSIQGTYLDPNAPQEQPNAGQEAMQQNLQANLPPGAAQPGAAPAQPGAAPPAGPQTAQGAAVPGLRLAPARFL